jgi:mono/diheme cytochrome c family protein
MNKHTAVLGLSLLAMGCDASAPPGGEGIVQRFGAISSSRAAPLGAATLDVSPDGTLAVAADPDRDAIFVVDLVTGTSHRIATNPEDELGQVLIAGNEAFVLARGTGEVLRINLSTNELEERFFVARGPTGLALEDGQTLHVACASGELVSFDLASGERTRRLLLEADLRDVVVWGDGLAVSRLRSAEVLFLDASGQVLEKYNPEEGGRGESTVAWRLKVVDQSLVLAHQYASNFVVPISEGGYGSDGFCGSSITTSMLTVIAVDGGLPSDSPQPDPALQPGPALTSLELTGTAGAIDFAGKSMDTLMVAAPGNGWATDRRRFLLTTTMSFPGASFDSTGCEEEREPEEPIVPVTVAVAQNTGTVVTQRRDPAVLRVDGSRVITLSDEARPDVGHRMFHMTTSLGISCASCHPEGRDDGHPWNFDQLGLRRSQSLRGGISELAPFHWDGSLPEFGDLMSEVFQSRMGLDVDPSDEEKAGMVDWLDRLPAGESGPDVDTDSAARGEELFNSREVGCVECHTGPRFADKLPHDVGTGGVFFTPPLDGIASRPPFMHDSCALTLKARFGACGGDDRHGKTSHLDDSQIDDLVAFMMTL